MDPHTYLQGTNQKFRLTYTELGREVRLVIGDGQLHMHARSSNQDSTNGVIENFFKNVKKAKDMMQLCQHQNIIKFIDYIEVQTSQGFKRYIISEYCVGGALENLMKKFGSIGEGDSLPLLRGLAFGLQYLHSLKITHRDINPANILMDGITPKYANFEFAKMQTIEVGTPQYMAPELLDEFGGYDEKIDVWALGLIFYKLLIGQFPWDIEQITNMPEIFNKIEDDCEVRFPRMVPVSDKMKKIITYMLKFSPEERYSSDQVVQELIG